jgi:hypothetical protein
MPWLVVMRHSRTLAHARARLSRVFEPPLIHAHTALQGCICSHHAVWRAH